MTTYIIKIKADFNHKRMVTCSVLSVPRSDTIRPLVTYAIINSEGAIRSQPIDTRS